MKICKRIINKIRKFFKDIKSILLKRRDTSLDFLGFVIYALIFIVGITLLIFGFLNLFG